MDPLGAEVGTADPFLTITDPNYTDVHSDAPMFMDGGDPFHLSDGCGDIDGMPASCAEISERMDNGTLGGESLAHGPNGWSIRRYNINGFGGVPRIFVSGGGVDTNPTWASDDDDHPVQIATDQGHWENLYFRQSSRTPAPPRVTDNMRAFQEAVTATQNILSSDNRCSRFFKGAGSEALAALASKVNDSSFSSSGQGNSSTGIEMSSDYTEVGRQKWTPCDVHAAARCRVNSCV
jgi:hypothetical protein